MAKTGGARKGAGRPKGSLNRRSTEALAAAAEQGIMPVEYMLQVLRDENADPQRRAWAAEKSAPYLHPRPAPLDSLLMIDLPDTSTLEGVEEAQGTIVRKVSAGEITPSQGQSLSALVEGRRRSIESNDLLKRIETLEAGRAVPGT